jgi:hypothetical protein
MDESPLLAPGTVLDGEAIVLVVASGVVGAMFNVDEVCIDVDAGAKVVVVDNPVGT